MKLRIFKTENEVKDLCITNAIARILDVNDFEYEVINRKAFYTIDTEEFDVEELEWVEIDPEDEVMRNINSYMSFGKDIKPQVDTLNEYMTTNIQDVFRYLNDRDDKKYKHLLKPQGSLHIGSVFETLGIRGGHTKESYKVTELERHLAFLGWVYSASYIKNDTMEISALIIPKQTKEILKPFHFSGVDKETGEIKTYRMLSNSTHMELMAKIYMKSMENKIYLKNYDEVIFSLARLAGNKPLPGEYFHFDTVDWSVELIDSFYRLYMSVAKDIETNIKLSEVILYKRYADFDSLIRLMATKSYWMSSKEDIKKEMVGMFNDKINQIYFCEAIERLGMAFSWLSRDKKAFDVQASLNTVSDKYSLQLVINELSQKYYKEKGKLIMNSEQLKELFDLIQDRKDAKAAATAILMSKTVFKSKDKDCEEVVEVVEEIE